MKGSAITRIVIYSLIILLLVGILWNCLRRDPFTFSFRIGSSGTPVEGTQTIDAEDVKKLKIAWAAGSVHIIAADVEAITVSEEGGSKDCRMTCDLKDGTLKLTYGSVQLGISSTSKKDLTVQVPMDWSCEKLDIDGAAIDLEINGLTVEELDLDGAANDLNFDGSIDKLDCDGAACILEVIAINKPSKFDIDGASCTLELTLPADCGFRAKLDGLNCDFDSTMDYKDSEGTYYCGDEYCKLDVDGVSCDVTIKAAKP